jgi:hypothetical protein
LLTIDIIKKHITNLQRRSQELHQQIVSSKDTLFEFQNLIIYIYHIIIIINLYLSISYDNHFSSVENINNEDDDHVHEDDQDDRNHQYNINNNKSNNNNINSTTSTFKSNKLSTNINKLSTSHIKNNYNITENHYHQQQQHQQQKQQDHHQFIYRTIYPLIHQLLTIMINTIIIPMISSLPLSSPYLCSFHDFSVTVYQMRLTLYTFEDNLIILHKINHNDHHHHHHHQQHNHHNQQQQEQQYKQLNSRINTHIKSKNKIDSNDKNLHIIDFDDDNDDNDYNNNNYNEDNKKHTTTSDNYSINYDDINYDNSNNKLSSFQQLVKLLTIFDDQIYQYIQGNLSAVIDFYEGKNDYYY